MKKAIVMLTVLALTIGGCTRNVNRYPDREHHSRRYDREHPVPPRDEYGRERRPY